MTTSAPKPSVSRLDRLRRRPRLRPFTVCVAPNSRGPLELSVVDVDGDDRPRTGQPSAGDRGVADTAAADDGDRVAATDAAGVDRRAEAGHDAAAEQPGDLGPRRRVDLGALPSRAPASSRRTRRCRGRGTAAVPSASVIFCVALWVLKQYQGLPRRQARHWPQTARQLRITKSPGATSVTSGADRLDDAGGLVAEQEREVVVDPALAVVQVGVADPAGLDGDDGLARPGVRDDDVDQLDGVRPWRAR